MIFGLNEKLLKIVISLLRTILELVKEHKVDFVDIEDPEVLRVLIAHGMSSSPLGLTTEDTGKITSFEDWFVNNKEVRFVDLCQFPNIEDVDLTGTFASVCFNGEHDSEDDISSLMLEGDDPNEIVPKSEIDEYLNNLH